MRIQKYMSEKGIASRREAERLIMLGLVTLNGKVVREMGVKIDPAKDKVALLPAAEKKFAQKTTVVVNKPRDIVSSRERREGSRPDRGGRPGGRRFGARRLRDDRDARRFAAGAPLRVAGDAMVHRVRPRACRLFRQRRHQRVRQLAGDHRAEAVTHTQANAVIVLAFLDETHAVDQELCRTPCVRLGESNRVDRPNRVLCWNWSAIPPGALVGGLSLYKLDRQAIGVNERDQVLTESLFEVEGYRCVREAVSPEVDRAYWDGQGNGYRLPSARFALIAAWMGKEREVRSRRAGLVAIEEVIGADVVLIHAHLHQPHPEKARVEIEIRLGIARNRGYVMDA